MMQTIPTNFFAIAGYLVALGLFALSYVFFVAAAFSITRSRGAKLTELQAQGVFGSGPAQHVVTQFESYLLLAQVGRLISALVAGVVFTRLTHALVALVAMDGFEYGGIFSAALFCVYVGVTLVIVQVAKACALQFPEVCLCFFALPLRLLYPILCPLVAVVRRVSSFALRYCRLRDVDERTLALSSQDLSEIVRRSSESGAIEENEQELLEGVVQLSGRIVREIMTPRTDVVFLRESATTAEVVALFQAEGVSRVLVCGDDLDDAKGMFLAKDLIRFIGQEIAEDAWRQHIRPATFVPNTKHLDELLGELREQGIHMAVVLDEHGGVDGIVTMEDLVEEIVGEIFDEFDTPDDEVEATVNPDGDLIVDGSVPVAELVDQHGFAIPEGDYDTIAGFVLAQLGHVPDAGEKLLFDDFEISVSEVQQNRVLKLVVHKVASAQNSQEPPIIAQAENGAPQGIEVPSAPSRLARIS
jgi:CBS domain containing-hemolysin-like protein